MGARALRHGSWGEAGLGAGMLAAYDSWAAEVAENDRRNGITALDAAADAASARANAAAQAIIAAPLTTPAGAAIKFAALLWRCRDGHGGFDDAGPIFAFAKELAAQACPCASAART